MERRGNDCWGPSRPCAGRSQLTLLFYMCFLPLLVPIGWSDLCFHSLFANHPLAAASQSIASTRTGDHAQSQLLAARGAISPTTSDTLMSLRGRSTGSPVAHWALRSITFTSRSLLVQMRSWHGKIHRTVGNMGKRLLSVNAALLFLECRGRRVLSFVVFLWARGKLWKVCFRKVTSSETLWGWGSEQSQRISFLFFYNQNTQG